MGHYEGLTYTTSIPKAGNMKTPQGRRMDARSGATSWAFSGLFELSRHVGMQKQLKPHFQEIKRHVADGRTVLVVCQFLEWKVQNGVGHQQPMLHFTFIGAVAENRDLAYRIYSHKQNQPILRPGPPPGWTLGQQLFHWFEDPKKEEKRNKSEIGNLYWDTVKK